MLEKEVEVNDKITGEFYTVKNHLVFDDKLAEIVGYEVSGLSAEEVEKILPRYKSNFNPQLTGIGELNEGPFLVDDTGYVPLDEILKRCIRQGVNPVRPVDGEFTEDDVMSSDDELSTAEVVPTTQTQAVDNSSVDNAETLSTQSQEQTTSESE